MNKAMAAKHSLINYGKAQKQWAAWFTYADGTRSTLHRLKLDGKPVLDGASTQDIADATLQLAQALTEQGGYKATTCKFKTFGDASDARIQWHSEHRVGTNRQRSLAKIVKAEFGNHMINAISDKDVKAFADKIVLSKKYSKITIKNILTFGSSVYTWMSEHDLYKGINPFSNAMKYVEDEHGSNLRIPPPPIKTLTDHELSLLWAALQEESRKAARIFWYVALHTGLRPSEIYGLKAERFSQNTLTYYRTKTHPMWREIYIPSCLWVFIKANCPPTGKILSTGTTGIRFQLRDACAEAGVKAVLKTPRKVFANRMKNAGAKFWQINLHQGRVFSGVLEQHYLELDPLDECKLFIEKMFESESQFSVPSLENRKAKTP